MKQDVRPAAGGPKTPEQAVNFNVLKDYSLHRNGRFCEFVLAYLAASAGLKTIFDRDHYDESLKSVAGNVRGEIDARLKLADLVTMARDLSLIHI